MFQTITALRENDKPCDFIENVAHQATRRSSLIPPRPIPVRGFYRAVMP
jgi:hypothetical protein